jgi:hypothetical protein
MTTRTISASSWHSHSPRAATVAARAAPPEAGRVASRALSDRIGRFRSRPWRHLFRLIDKRVDAHHNVASPGNSGPPSPHEPRPHPFTFWRLHGLWRLTRRETRRALMPRVGRCDRADESQGPATSKQVPTCPGAHPQARHSAQKDRVRIVSSPAGFAIGDIVDGRRNSGRD